MKAQYLRPHHLFLVAVVAQGKCMKEREEREESGIWRDFSLEIFKVRGRSFDGSFPSALLLPTTS